MAMQSTAQNERRGEVVAMIGLLLQVTVTILVLLLALNTGSGDEGTGSSAAWAEVGHLAAGIGLWLVLWLVFNQRKRVRREIFETEALRREREERGTEGAIFDVSDEELMLARRRLSAMYRWLLPGFTIFLGLQLTITALWSSWPLGRGLTSEEWSAVANTNVTMWFTGGLTLALFLFSRYATGLARLPEWRMLRAGASFTLGSTLMLFLLAVALGAYRTSAVPEHLLAYIVRGLMLLLAVELFLNFVLDFYRPRIPDEEPRPAFDSRLLGLLSEPGAVAHSIAEAVNYQFGFEVSTTWFYQLMQRAIVPLICFGVFVLIGLSAVVVVEPHERAVVERWGRPVREVRETDKVRVLKPGFHLKCPWPIDRAYRHSVAEVQEIVLGVGDTHGEDGHDHEAHGREIVLWTETGHFGHEHLDLLVAADSGVAQSTNGKAAQSQPATAPAEFESERAVPVSIIQAIVPVFYTVSDLGKYLYKYEDPKSLLEAVAYRELVRLAATLDLQEIMGARRAEATTRLREGIERRIGPEGLDMGVEVTFVGLAGLHPPRDVAPSFQSVMGARIEEETLTLAAEARAINTKIGVAGRVEQADRLSRAIAKVQDLGQAGASADQRAEAEAQARRLLLGDGGTTLPTGGEAAQRILKAQAERWSKEARAQASVEQFLRELPGFLAAPELYRMRRYLGVMSEALKDVKKYVVAVDTDRPPTVILRDKTTAGTAIDWTESGIGEGEGQ